MASTPRTATAALAAVVVTLLAATLLAATPAAAQPRHFGRATAPAQSETYGQTTTPTATFTGDEVLVAVGESLQAAVDRHPAGTAFRIATGTHRNQSVVPKDGNAFIGEPGAVLSGARVLDPASFRRQGGQWILGGQTDDTTWHGEMVPGKERHAAQQDLWIGGQLADHVPTRADVDAPGEWFYDYDRDEIVIGQEPTRARGLELAVTEHAFSGTATGVTIAHLTITRYAPRAQMGAIQGDLARHWVIRNNTVTANHGVNVRVGAGFEVRGNEITYAGQLGIGGLDYKDGYQAQLVVAQNEIAHNHTLGYDWGWEAGATKFVKTTGMIFEQNWVHHNDGPGPWFDIENRDAIIRSNLVEHNTMVGIFYEISYGAEIYDNISRFNGSEAWGDLGAGVYVSSSTDVEIHHNALYGNRSEVLATQGDRGVGRFGLHEVRGMHVHHNDMALGEVAPGIRVEHGDPHHYVFEAGNRFEANTYRIDAGQPNFWANAHLPLDAWQQAGNDTQARVLPAGTTPQLPAGATPFAPVPYGAA